MIVGSLEIKLFASLARLQSDMDKAGKTVDAAMSRIDKAIGTTKAAFTGLAGAFGAQSIVRLADEYKRFDSQLKLATRSAAQYEEAYSRVAAISTKSQSDIGAIGVLYARLANNLRDAGISQQEVGDIAESIALTLRVANATVQETNSVMLQLSQSFGSGKLNGQEFLAVAEGAPALLRQVAKEMGKTYGELKNLATEGKITADVLKRAWTNPEYLEGVREQVKQVGTIASAMTVLKNNLTLYIGEADKATGTSRLLSQAIIFLSENINALVTLGIAALITSLGRTVTATMAAIQASRLRQAEILKEQILAQRAAAAQIAAENAKIAATTKAYAATYGGAAAAVAFNKRVSESFIASGLAASRSAGVIGTALTGLRGIFFALGGWVTVAIGALTLLYMWFNKTKTASEQFADSIKERMNNAGKLQKEYEKATGKSGISPFAAEETNLATAIKNRQEAEKNLAEIVANRNKGNISGANTAIKYQEAIAKVAESLKIVTETEEALQMARDAAAAKDPTKIAQQEFNALNATLKTARNERAAYNEEVAKYVELGRKANASEAVIAEGIKAIADKYKTIRKDQKEDNKYLEESLTSRADANKELLQGAYELTAVEQTEIQKLQELIPLYANASDSVIQYANAQIALRRELDMQSNHAEVFADTLDREAEMQNAIDEEKMASAQGVSDFYTDLYTKQQKEYEELQIATIKYDTERQRKQLELESKRMVEVIRNSQLEESLKEQLIADEERNLELRLRAADAQKGMWKDLRDAIDGYSKDMAKSMADFITGTETSFSDMINSMLKNLLILANQRLIFDPLIEAFKGTDFFSSLGKVFSNANGGVYSGKGISSYSSSVVSQPTVFPFAKGIGLMGEAGAEAIMPLQRDSSGRLGVSAQGGGGNVVNIQVVEAQGTKANVEQQQNPDGTMSIKVIVEQLYGVMNRDLQRGGGIAPTLERRYGLNRVAGA